jgi:hypothetical protein
MSIDEKLSMKYLPSEDYNTLRNCSRCTANLYGIITRKSLILLMYVNSKLKFKTTGHIP